MKKTINLFVFALTCVSCLFCPQKILAQNMESNSVSSFITDERKAGVLCGEWTHPGFKFGFSPYCFRITQGANGLIIEVPSEVVDEIDGEVLHWQKTSLIANDLYGVWEIFPKNTREKSCYGINYKKSQGGYRFGLVQIVIDGDSITHNSMYAMTTEYNERVDGNGWKKMTKFPLGWIRYIKVNPKLYDSTAGSANLSELEEIKIEFEKLSEQGKQYYRTIELLNVTPAVPLLFDDELAEDALEGGIKTDERIIELLEKITETDSNYAPVYYELGKRCLVIGKYKGEPYFLKAEKYFWKYGNIKNTSVTKHLSLVDNMRREFNQQRTCY